MAEHASDHTHGQMDIHQNQASFDIFVRMTKWGSLAVAVIVLYATLAFCTETGWAAAIIPALILLLLGVIFLKSKPAHAAAH
jgi:hypothetical protein